VLKDRKDNALLGLSLVKFGNLLGLLFQALDEIANLLGHVLSLS
jgi:hypothetical protein